MRYDKKKYVCFTGCLILTVFLLCGCRKESDIVITGSGAQVSQPEISDPEISDREPAGNSLQVDVSKEEVQEDLPVAADTIYVQVTGAVRAPGVYELPAGSRVFEAVQKAGGMTDDAAGESVNQAVEVSDGDMIVLYTRQEWEQRSTQQTGGAGGDSGSIQGQQQADGRVDINTADVTQLCTIPGIGETRARSIITYREQNGAFEAVEDIMKVSGIKDGLFQKIKDKIKV
nr:helix-hairpin-helix domain-containing protein [Lachnospiraceae bacterium]